MSVSAVSQSQAASTQDGHDIETIRKNLSTFKNWTYLIPTVGAIALGIIFAPSSAIGVTVGAVNFVVMGITSIAVNALGWMSPDEDSEYSKTIHDNPLLGTLVAPILEELTFRGGMQPLLTRGVLWLAPAAAGAFLGSSMSIAATVALVATAALFGAVHCFNDHKNAHIQAIFCTVSGVADGLLALHFGLGASIAAHIVNNTLAITLCKLFYKGKPPHSTSSAVTSGGMIRV